MRYKKSNYLKITYCSMLSARLNRKPLKNKRPLEATSITDMVDKFFAKFKRVFDVEVNVLK